MTYQVLYIPTSNRLNHQCEKPGTEDGLVNTIIKCDDCGKMYVLSYVYDRYISALEWVEYEGCPYGDSHTRSWCGYDECRES